jgi:hypothetical protein
MAHFHQNLGKDMPLAVGILYFMVVRLPWQHRTLSIQSVSELL